MWKKLLTIIVVGYVAGVLLWIVLGLTVIPNLVRDAYHQQSYSFLNNVISNRANLPLDHYLNHWTTLFIKSLIVLIFVVPVVVIPCSNLFKFPKRFFHDHVTPAHALDLGVIRIIVCLIVLLNLLWEDLASISFLPPEALTEIGVMRWVHLIPGWTSLYQSYAALAFLQYATLALVVFSMLGYRTRWTLPLAAIAVIVIGGILRNASGFFHTGIIPLYLLALMSFLPMGDGLSLDRRAGRVSPRSPQAYGWCRFYCWIFVACAYVSAGLCKYRNEGFFWFKGENLKYFVMTDSLNPMQFEPGLQEFFAPIPEYYFALFGLGAFVIESTFYLVLFYRWARYLSPLAAIGMHAGIWVCQGILFYDLMLIQLIFLPWSTWLGHKNSTDPITESSTNQAIWHGWRMGVAYGLVMASALVWHFRFEQYPLTAWPMYSTGPDDQYVRYLRVYAIDEQGKETIFYPESVIGAYYDSRYRKILGQETRQQLIFQTILNEYNRRHPNHRLKRLEVRHYLWDTRSNQPGPFYTTPDSVFFVEAVDQN